MKKPFITILLLFTVMTTTVFADSDLSLSDASGGYGNTVSITMNMSNNGACVGSFVLEYDNDKLEFSDSMFSDKFSAASPMINSSFKPNQIKINWLSLDSAIDFADFCTLRFKIKSTVSATSTIDVVEYKLYDMDTKPIDVTLNKAVITIKNTTLQPTTRGGSSSHSGGGSSSGKQNVDTSIQLSEIDASIPVQFENQTLPSFNDLDNYKWAEEAITYLAEKNIVTGVTKTEYAPEDNVTRAQFITVLCRAYSISEMTGDNFSDCGDTWYTGYLAAAKQLGISGGVGDNKFAPEKEITREEMVTLIYNYLKSVGKADEKTDTTDFADKDAISAWAKTAVDYASKNGIVKGNDNNMFAPNDTANRAELAQIFYNLLINLH